VAAPLTAHVPTTLGYPAAVTSNKPFGGLTITHDDSVLEPREWTTAQSRWAAELLGGSPQGAVLELCSGAGHIGLLAVTLTRRPLVQVDVNPDACANARANAAAAGAADLVEVVEGPVEGALGADARFVGVIADPPWVPSAETSRFPTDPRPAIDGGPEGLDMVRACVRVAARHLLEGGWLLLQVGSERQVRELERWLTDGPDAPSLAVREVRSYGERGVLVHLALVPLA
jgi:methylase of polypeptide subunit release factors